MTEIGQRLKKIRESRSLNQKQFGDNIGVSTYETVSRWERGLGYPSADILETIRQKYLINIDWLISGEGEMLLENQSAGTLPASVNAHLLQQILKGVEMGLARLKRTLDPDKKAQLVILLYEHYAKTGEAPEPKTVEKYLRLVA